MSKRSVAYVKPREPSFLTRLKEQVGYKEGPTVNTKREQLDFCSDESDNEDSQPVVVVLKPGDLTAEEVKKVKKEAEEAPADLSERVVFKKPDKNKRGPEAEGGAEPKKSKSSSTSGKSDEGVHKSKDKKKNSSTPAGALSFSNHDEEESE